MIKRTFLLVSIIGIFSSSLAFDGLFPVEPTLPVSLKTNFSTGAVFKLPNTVGQFVTVNHEGFIGRPLKIDPQYQGCAAQLKSEWAGKKIRFEARGRTLTITGASTRYLDSVPSLRDPASSAEHRVEVILNVKDSSPTAAIQKVVCVVGVEGQSNDTPETIAANLRGAMPVETALSSLKSNLGLPRGITLASPVQEVLLIDNSKARSQCSSADNC